MKEHQCLRPRTAEWRAGSTSMKTFLLILVCLLTSCVMLVRAQACSELTVYQASQKNISCEEAAKNAPQIKVGMKEAEVLELLGSPSARTGDKWDYDFT